MLKNMKMPNFCIELPKIIANLLEKNCCSWHNWSAWDQDDLMVFSSTNFKLSKYGRCWLFAVSFHVVILERPPGQIGERRMTRWFYRQRKPGFEAQTNSSVQCAKVFEKKVLSYNAALCLHYTICRHVVDRIQDQAFSFYIAYFTRHFLKNKVILWDHCHSPPPVFASRKSESPSISSSWGHSQHSQIFLLLFDNTFSRSLVASPLFVLLISAPLFGLLVKDVNNVSSLWKRTIFNIQF